MQIVFSFKKVVDQGYFYRSLRKSEELRDQSATLSLSLGVRVWRRRKEKGRNGEKESVQ
jgi:hypothetical protein